MAQHAKGDVTMREIVHGYPDIQRTDSSRPTRNDIYLGWGVGEQLWDEDVKNTFTFANWWRGTTVFNFREPWSPWKNGPALEHYVDREDNNLYWLTNGNGEGMKPFSGAYCYAEADYLYVGFTGETWKPMCEVPIWKPRVEISIYVSAAQSSTPPSFIVTEAFSVPEDAPFSRVRGLKPGTSLAIYKNGVKVGSAYLSDSLSRITFDAEVTFEVGDVIGLPGGIRNISLTIFGKRI